MDALNSLETFTERMSEEVAEGRLNVSDAGMVSLLAHVLNGSIAAAERLAGACYVYSLHRPNSYFGEWPKLDRTNN